MPADCRQIFHRTKALHIIAVMMACLFLGPTLDVRAQSLQRAVFVANDGNLEGSVSSYLVEPDGSLSFVEKLVIGSTNSTTNPVPGTNARSLSISPNGRYLAVGHATAASDFEQLTIVAVAPDATLSIFAVFSVPDSPLANQWLSDTVLAVARTSLSVTNEAQSYAFDPEAEVPTLTLIDAEPTGTFSSSLAHEPRTDTLYAQSTLGGNTITVLTVEPDGFLTPLQTLSTGATFPLGLGVSPDGKKLYAGGGISSGGNAVLGFDIAGDGGLSAQTGSPFASPGDSPALVVVSSDNRFAYAGHGGDATIHAFAIDDISGALTSTGFSFDVGFQGSLGDLAVLGELLLATDSDTIIDGQRGLYSFTINGDGSLTQNGPLVDSQGIGPTEIATWLPIGPPPCPGDLNGDQTIDEADLGAALTVWNTSGPFGDLNGDGSVDPRDYILIIDLYGPCSQAVEGSDMPK